MKKALKLPKFKNEDEERNFWAKIDVTDYFDSSDFERASFPNLRPTVKPMSIRMPISMVWAVKTNANAIDIPYQALIKKYIADGIKRDNALTARSVK